MHLAQILETHSSFLRISAPISLRFHILFDKRSVFGIVRTFHGVVPVAFWFAMVNGNNQHIVSFYFVPVAFYFDHTAIFARL